MSNSALEINHGILDPAAILPVLANFRLPKVADLTDDTRYGLDNVGGPNVTSYADILFARASNPSENPQWRQALAGQIVIDLAAGPNPYGYLVANAAGAKGYIGLEAYNYRNLNFALSDSGLKRSFERLAEESDFVRPDSFIPRAFVPEDMLTFLERLPERSVSVFGVGLHYILENNYINRVNAELSRVVADQGCLITYPEGSGLRLKGVRGEELSCAQIFKNIQAK